MPPVPAPPVQTPPWQACPVPQTTPHCPQFWASVARSAHFEAQALVPAGQWQLPPTHEAPSGQARSQTPQWLAFVCTSTQLVPHCVSPGRAQEPWQTPAEQT